MSDISKIIDLRSDTVTKPTPEMLQYMMQAQVGDDVYGEDPTVIQLQELTANYFGMEAGLFCPSGTMTNQIAIKVHTRPADELICADNAHIYKYEGGGIASNAGVQARTVASDRGRIQAAQIEQCINGDDPHFPVTRLVCLENTSNRGGGSLYSMDEMKTIHQLCKSRNLFFHLDGARIFNAIIAGNQNPKDYGNLFDSISICLSKGLGAPIGSVLLGNKKFIYQAKRVRKAFGGGMRQAGYLAAAGIYAMQNHINRLTEDHQHAQTVASALTENIHVTDIMPVETNIIIFTCTNPQTTDKFLAHLLAHHIKANKVSADSIRFVFHLDITPEMVTNLTHVIRQF
jgi:threonine aldolase